MSLWNSLDAVDADMDVGAHWGNNQKVLNPDKF